MTSEGKAVRNCESFEVLVEDKFIISLILVATVSNPTAVTRSKHETHTWPFLRGSRVSLTPLMSNKRMWRLSCGRAIILFTGDTESLKKEHREESLYCKTVIGIGHSGIAQGTGASFKFETIYINWHHQTKANFEIGHLSKFDAFRSNKDQVTSRYDPRSYGRTFSNCAEKHEKFRTSTGFEPVTSRYRCDALTNWAMKPLKPLTLGASAKIASQNCEDQFIDWFKFETRPSILRNSGMAYGERIGAERLNKCPYIKIRSTEKKTLFPMNGHENYNALFKDLRNLRYWSTIIILCSMVSQNVFYNDCSVLNSAARLIHLSSRYEHITLSLAPYWTLITLLSLHSRLTMVLHLTISLSS